MKNRFIKIYKNYARGLFIMRHGDSHVEDKTFWYSYCQSIKNSFNNAKFHSHYTLIEEIDTAFRKMDCSYITNKDVSEYTDKLIQQLKNKKNST